MQVYTFDFICECQDFNHNEEFVLKEDLDSEIESKQKEITALKSREKKLVEVVKFYAPEKDWWYWQPDGGRLTSTHTSWITSDKGKRAREVLKDLGVEL